MTEVQNKLSVWAKLYKQCEEMESRLRSSKVREGDELAPHEIKLRTEYLDLKARTDAAFREASEALKASERGDKPGSRR